MSPLEYMKHYARYIAELLPPERRHTAVQAGGHTGTVPKILAAYFERVLTFEPDPINFVHLTEQLQNTGVSVMEAALSSKHGQLPITTPPGRTDLTHIVNDSSGRAVDCIPLDHFSFQTVDLLALDVAGHELEALEGAVDTIYKHRPVIVVEQGVLRGIPGRRAECGQWLKDHEYVQTNFCNSDFIYRHISDVQQQDPPSAA